MRSKPRWDYAREPENERPTQFDLARDICIKPGMNVINVEKGRSFTSSLGQCVSGDIYIANRRG